MGASCCKSSDALGSGTVPAGTGAQSETLLVMFRRIDKEGKGYINLKNLEDLMKDGKANFAGKGADHIMEKYGTDGRMEIEHFTTWWNSTYTSYNEDALAQIVEDAQADNILEQHMEPFPVHPIVPHNSDVAVSRS